MTEPTNLFPVDLSLQSLTVAAAVHGSLLSSLLDTLADSGTIDEHTLETIFAKADGRIDEAAPMLDHLGEEVAARMRTRAKEMLRNIAENVGRVSPRS